MELPQKPSIQEQLGVLFKPSNLLKTFAAFAPGTSAATEILSQLEGHALEQRVNILEKNLPSLPELKRTPSADTSSADWPSAAGEFASRTAELAIRYDGGFHSAARRGQELTLPVAHGCLITATEFLTCGEALNLAREIANQRHGEIIITLGPVRYNIKDAEIDATTGLVVCEITSRDDVHLNSIIKKLTERGLEKSLLNNFSVPAKQVEYTIQPWIAQNIGFFHVGEAENIMSVDNFAKHQFEISYISHFRRMSEDSIKSFVTGVIPSRFLFSGSPIFTEKRVLLGIVSDTDSYKSDAGRRAVVRSLFGHPRFMRRGNVPSL